MASIAAVDCWDVSSSDSDADESELGELEILSETDAKDSKKGTKKRKLYDWKLLASNLTREEADSYPDMVLHKSKSGVRGAGPGSKVLQCAVHRECPHMMRIQCKKSDELYEVYECDVHSTDMADFDTSKQGLPRILLPILDPLLRANMTPKTAAVELRKVLSSTPMGKKVLETLIPDDNDSSKAYQSLLTKIGNRKRTINNARTAEQTPYHVNKLLMGKALDITAEAADVQASLSTLGETFGADGLLCCARLPLPPTSPLLAPHSTINASTSTAPTSTAPSEPAVEGTTAPLSGYVFTSQRWLQNLGNAVRDMSTGLSLGADGTYKLVHSNWTLLIATTHTINLPQQDSGRKSDVTHTAVPLMAALVETESYYTYAALFGALRVAAEKLVSGAAPVRVLSMSMDHCWSIKNAAEWIFGTQVSVVDCWPHLMRNARKKASKLLTYFTSTIEPHLHKIHCAGSITVVYDLAIAATREWEGAGYGEYANWFREVYLDGGWSGWWCGASRVPGAGPTNNPLEALNKDIKDVIDKRCTMTEFIDTGFPRFLAATAQRRCPSVLLRDVGHDQTRLLQEGVLPRAVVDSAISMVQTKKAVVRTKLTSGLYRYYVSSSSYLNSQITNERVEARRKRFADGADPAEPSTVPESFDALHARRCSIHVVEVVVAPGLKNRLQCDCKGYWVSSYLCSHVLAAAHHEGVINLHAVRTTFTGPRRGGRPANRAKALVPDDSAPTTATSTSNGRSLKLCNLCGASVFGVGEWKGKGIGVVGPFHKHTKRFSVSFPYAPEGAIQVEATEESVRECYVAHEEFLKEQRRLLASRADDASL